MALSSVCSVHSALHFLRVSADCCACVAVWCGARRAARRRRTQCNQNHTVAAQPGVAAHRHPHRAHHVHGARHAARHGHGTPTRLAQRGSLVASTSSGAPRHTLARARCGWLHVGCQPNRTAGPKATPRHQPSLRGGAWSAGSLARQAQRAAGHARGHTTPRALTSLPLRHKSPAICVRDNANRTAEQLRVERDGTPRREVRSSIDQHMLRERAVWRVHIHPTRHVHTVCMCVSCARVKPSHACGARAPARVSDRCDVRRVWGCVGVWCGKKHENRALTLVYVASEMREPTPRGSAAKARTRVD